MPTSDPVVCCVMLASGREEMVARAVRSFQAQTYRNKRLLILDNGRPRIQASLPGNAAYVTADPASIGVLRNVANKFAGQLTGADIIAHWDSDDWSHPNRIAEQVMLLQSSGAECVGYNEMLFWATCCPDYGEAWLYRSQLPNYAIGTSMMYWRGTWERNPFPDRSEGCDDLYWHTGERVKIFAGSSVPDLTWGRHSVTVKPEDIGAEPRMIASLHGGNTCAEIKPGVEWTRASEWDEYARGVMKL